MLARDLHPLGERNEGVVVAGHHHAIFAALLDALAQCHGEIEHDGLFGLAALRLRSMIDAAVTGVNHHHRPRIVGVCA